MYSRKDLLCSGVKKEEERRQDGELQDEGGERQGSNESKSSRGHSLVERGA